MDPTYDEIMAAMKQAWARRKEAAAFRRTRGDMQSAIFEENLAVGIEIAMNAAEGAFFDKAREEGGGTGEATAVNQNCA